MKLNNVKLPLFAAALGAMLAVSCGSSEELAYVHDAPRNEESPITGRFTKGIQANDLLSIYVESETPAATIPFNQETNKIAMSDGVVMNPGSSAVNGYLVNNEGDIIFPVLGRVHVLGMTHDELASELQRRLVSEGHILDAQVTVKLMNFKVCVLGDVARPGMIVANGERMTIFEALSMVGDLTIYGMRDNVTLIRENSKGEKSFHRLNLNDANIVNSPFYYLQQNDILYVEPNETKAKSSTIGSSTNLWLSATGILVSVATLLVSIFK